MQISKSTTTKLEDTSLMTFGKYKGFLMEEVPANYLHWFWHNNTLDTQQALAVMQYIKDNLDALKLENKDLIWKK